MKRLLQHGLIPPNVDFGDPIDLEQNLNIRLSKEAVPWPKNKNRYAGISSFGWSAGTNSHVIIKDSNYYDPSAIKVPELMILTGKNLSALRANSEKMMNYLLSNPQFSLSDICFTTRLNRTHFQYRKCVVGCNSNDFVDILKNYESFTPLEFIALKMPFVTLAIGKRNHLFPFVFQGLSQRFESLNVIFEHLCNQISSQMKSEHGASSNLQKIRVGIIERTHVDMAMLALLQFMQKLFVRFEVISHESDMSIIALFHKEVSLTDYLKDIIDKLSDENSNELTRSENSSQKHQEESFAFQVRISEETTPETTLWSTEMLKFTSEKTLIDSSETKQH